MNKNDLIMGHHCLDELLKIDPARVIQVFTSQRNKKDPLYQSLLSNKIPIKEMNKQALSLMVESTSHMGYVAKVKPRKKWKLDEFYKKEKCLLIMLDQIFDPQNFGAILRSAECFGADGVIYSKNRGTSITPVVTKTSSGASELIRLIEVSNLADSLRKLKKEGFFIIATALDENAISLDAFSFPDKTLLILGSEGKGIQPLLLKLADEKIAIPMQGKISSLNVAQAASVFLYAFSSKINKKKGSQ